MKLRSIPLTRGDRVIYLILLLFFLLSLLLPSAIPLFRGNADRVRVDADGTVSVYPLGRDADYPIVSCGHTLTVSVRDGGVSVSHADCPDHLCEKTGVIRRAGQSVVCLPARVIVTVEGGEPDADIIIG